MFANIADNIGAIFFLGTPHFGSTFTRWGSIAARAIQPLGSNPFIINEVAHDSPYLRDLHRRFVLNAKIESKVVNFFEQRKTRLLKIWFQQWEEFVSRRA